MVRPKNKDVTDHWRIVADHTDPAKVKWGCNYCNKVYVRNATRQAEHLESTCPQYKPAHPSKKRNVGQLLLNHQHLSSSSSEIEEAPSVGQINFPRSTTEAQKHELDLDAAMSVYMGNQPFNTYENPYHKRFLSRLNRAYTPPTPKAIAGDLLDEVYSNVKAQTDRLVANLEHINVSLDESADIKANRTVNVSIHSYRQRHLLNNAAYVVRDREIRLRHCFFVPCDAHGIQLLVNDLLKLPGLSATLQKAQCLAESFRNAPLPYARLREFQMEVYGKHQSLILSVMTRWGTQYSLVQSLIDNKDAIKRYADEFGLLPLSERIEKPALEAIRSTEFWVKLEALRELLKPIDKCLRMSKSGKSHLGHVLNRLKDISKHLKNRMCENEELKSFIGNGGFMARYNRQVLAIHITAFYLTPTTAINDIRNDSLDLPIDVETQITQFLQRYSPSAEAARAAFCEFKLFRSQQPPFESNRLCWNEHEDPHMFWCIGRTLAKNIGTIAFRLFSAPVNSVASERAFSVQNFIHSKTLNRLQPAQADKLSFVYSNSRILYRDGIPIMRPVVSDSDLASKPMRDLTPEEQMAVEDYLLKLEVDDETVASEEIEVNDGSDEEQADDDEMDW